VVDRLSINVLLGMDFIRYNYCVPFANKQLFSLGNGRVWVPIGVGVSVLGVAKLYEPQVGGLHQKLKNNTVFLFEPLLNTGVPGTIPQGNNHALTHICPQTRPTDYINMVKDTCSNLSGSTCTTLDPKSRTFYSQNNTFARKCI